MSRFAPKSWPQLHKVRRVFRVFFASSRLQHHRPYSWGIQCWIVLNCGYMILRSLGYHELYSWSRFIVNYPYAMYMR